MAAFAGILNHATAAQSLAGSATPMDNSTSGTSGSSSATSDSATISANDFLTLLVTEMQNQDPTADTDPNEYINQLVEVNSLEQLIDINQTLSTALDPSATGSTGDSASPQAQSVAASPQTGGAAGTPQSAAQPAKLPALAQPPGNLAVPSANTAAQRVAHALDGSRPAHRPAGALSLP